jgi:hypothetical protein
MNQFHSETFRKALVIASIFLATQAVADEASDDLSSQATDPTASLMALNFLADYTGGFYGPDADGKDATTLTFRPAIPFKAFGVNNIMRLTLPYQIDGRGEEGMGDVSVFDIVVSNHSWGRLAIGAVGSLASSDSAEDKFAIGPAIGVVIPLSKRLSVGAFNQNVFAGDTAISQLQPVVAYQLGNGWSLNPQYNLRDAQGLETWSVTFTFSLLVPGT